jgi:hypothetical protein
MKTRKVALTPATIDALKSARIWDLLTPGLGIEVLRRGRKRWIYRRHVAGTDVMATMFGGSFPAESTADALEGARSLNEHVEAGIEPHKRCARRRRAQIADV